MFALPCHVSASMCPTGVNPEVNTLARPFVFTGDDTPALEAEGEDYRLCSFFGSSFESWLGHLLSFCLINCLIKACFPHLSIKPRETLFQTVRAPRPSTTTRRGAPGGPCRPPAPLQSALTINTHSCVLS